MKKTLGALSLVLLATAAGCAADGATGDNPFEQNMDNDGKEDTAYVNPDGVEVEVDLEGDVEGKSYQLKDGPAMLAQFATTYFRKQEKLFIESLAEDAASADRAEWLVNGTWYKQTELPAGAALKHWRLRGVNAVLLFSAGDAKVGKVFKAPAPQKPFSVLADAGDKCADDDDHIGLDESVYWYRWEPNKASCKIAKQDLTITVSKTFAASQSTVYPEYDKLTADGVVTAVVLFGQIDDGEITDSETGMQAFKQFGTYLKQAHYTEKTAPLGRRFEKKASNGVTMQIDLYSPREFSGLGDYAHFANFQKALSEHEIVAYDGHSMLGASDFWSRPTYPSSYQIFLYGGCLGYEYYVRPILAGKGGTWDNLDIMSSVVEVSANASDFAAPAIAKMFWALEHNYKASWRDLLVQVRRNVGDSTFGVSGVRDNKFKPTTAGH